MGSSQVEETNNPRTRATVHTCRGAIRSESAECFPWGCAVHNLSSRSGNLADHEGPHVTCQVGWMPIVEVVFVLEEGGN